MPTIKPSSNLQHNKKVIKQKGLCCIWCYSSTCCTRPVVRPRHIMHRLFLNVGYDLSEQQLRPYFAKFGTIKDLYLPKNVSGRNKGYGFLTYSTKSALSSVAQQPRHVVDGKVVQVRRVGTPVCCFVKCAFVVYVFRSVSSRTCLPNVLNLRLLYR